MKQSIIALLLMATAPLYAQQTATKVKPAHPTPPPAAQTTTKTPRKSLGTLTTSLVEVNDKSVSLRWNNPETINGLFDDFEGHSDFVINSPGDIGWQYIDADNADTYTWTAADYPNQGQKMAFIVFNPSKTSPSTETWPDIKPYSSNKMLIDFTVDGGNNDYIISPALNFDEDFQFSFRARSYTESYGKERYRIGYSTTGTRPSDFTFVQEGDYAEVPAAWTLCKYTIPKEAKYVCINCVSQEAFMFMVDDIFIGTNIVRPKAPAARRLNGFNLLRNGVKVNNSLIEETSYTDNVPDYATYTYTVQAVMTDGTTDVASEPLEVEVPDIRLLPFEDNFDGTTIDTTLWSRPTDDKGNENKWKRDYHPYGLVDYAACYPYSNISGNYSQSLVSRELRTPDAANTYLRFQVRLDNDPKYTGNYISAEVSPDDGATWTSLVDIANDEGSFEWRTYEYPLSDALNGAEFFKVRFRAHGSNAWQINYWYIDDVKVWCPQTRATQLNVTSGGQPAAGATVTLTADNGAIYTGTTDAQGTFSLPRMEIGNYELTVDSDGCNRLTTEWNLTADSPTTKSVTLLRPIINWSETDINVGIAQEATADRTVTITNSGDGPAYWNIAPQPEPQSCDTTHLFTPGEGFDASGDLQSSVVFDGEYFYTASSYTMGRYYKYDREGHFIEEFTIPGMYFIQYDFAYDGTYVYASDYTNRIFQLDLRNKRMVRYWDVKDQSSLKITHIAYDPRSDQFWIGSWTKLGRVDREGNVTVDFFYIDSSNDNVAVMGSAFDNVSKGGPYLWFSNLAHSGNNVVDNIQLLQFDLNNRRLTSVSHTVTDIEGYKVGTDEVPNNIGGLELTTQLVPSQLTMVGILQQSPSRIYTYNVADLGTWYTAQPFSGTLQAGEQAEVKIHFNARDLALNETRNATLSFGTSPVLTGTSDLKLSLTANAASAQPRPVNFSATVNDSTYTVSLKWDAATGSEPTAYEVIRDSVKIATVKATSYEDAGLVRGNYTYTVRALYGNDDIASADADSVNVTVKVGAPYFTPTALKASIANNKDVTLTWQRPDALLHSNATLRWDNNKNDDAIGVSSGGYFYAGVAFDADDLEAYRGMNLSSVDVFIKERVQALYVYVYKDGKRVTSKRINTGDIKYGEFNNFILDTPVTIDRGCEYRVAVMMMHDNGLTPLGCNSNTTVEGKSNLMSTDGRTWYPASYAGFANANFNIAANLTPATDYEEVAPTAYAIIRNGEKVGQVSETTFTETLKEPADYEYQVVSMYGENKVSAASNTAKVTVENIGTPTAPATVTVSVERNRNVELRWGFPIAAEPSVPVNTTSSAGISPTDRPEFVSMFRGAFTGETGIASDGNYIYTTRYNAAGIVNRYNMDGSLSESLGIATNLSEGFRDLTFDGTDFWTTANGSEIYKLDMTEPSIADTRSISEIARHIAYVPTLDNGLGGFEVGDWETSINVTMQGAKLSNGPTLKGAAGAAYYDGVLYTFEQGYETPYELCARNFETGELLWHNSIADWTAITPATSASAGGMSVLNTKEGLNLLCLALQEPTGTRFIFLDLGSVKGLDGYNVYRNGVKLNDKPLPQRVFTETVSEPGDYDYQIQTVYIDGTVSALSDAQTITIVPATPGDAPSDIKAKTTTAGYNVNISVVDPTTMTADQFESFEEDDAINATGFKVASDDAFSGIHSLEAPVETECEVIIPIEKAYTEDFSFGFVTRNANDGEGAGTVQVLTSSSDTEAANFVNLSSVSTTEAWTQYYFTLPAATRYVALRCPSRYARQLIDAISVNATKPGQIYGFDIMRGDQLLNGDKPVSGVSYTDHNLLPGTYTYKVRAYYDNSSVSEWSEPVSISVEYDNGHQAPGQLSVEQTDEGNLLQWSTPALSAVTELRWHNGVSAGSAGLPSGGSYYAGVQFDTDVLKDYSSMSISEVSFYINQIPDVLFVQLYEGQDLVFEKYVPTLRQYSMNTVTLDKPITVNTSKSLRAVIYVEHNSITVPLGYDAGPAKTGLGDLYSSDGTTWSTLTDNDIDGNWNISIGLQAYATESDAQATTAAPQERYVRHAAGAKNINTAPLAVPYTAPTAASSFFSGYSVYCNGELLNTTPLTVNTNEYLDTATHKGRYYEYQVKAVYPDYGEVGSNVVRILGTTGIDNITIDGKSDTPVYTIDGVQTDKSRRGIVIQDGRKRIQR